MLKVLFYHATSVTTDPRLELGVAVLYLKTHIDTHCFDIKDKIEWLVPKQYQTDDDDLVSLCNDQKIDLLCSSHYIWNHSQLMLQLERIHSRLSDTKIVAGGPSIDVHIDDNFFKKYPFIDYAVYGAGENAFASLLESIIFNRKLIAFNTSNLAWQDQGKQIVSQFKYVPQLAASPYTSNRKLFTKMIEQEVKNGKSLEHIQIPYELTRGCPYACTFCDWNSGLSNKVSRRKNTYKEEIDFFHELGIRCIFLADANVGQYNEDINVVDYFAKKNIENDAKFHLEANFSKLKKENNLKIFHIMGKANLVERYMISVQDPNVSVLKNIDRPDVGWDEHEKIINEIYQSYPNIPLWVQIIQGLPGQTVDTWRDSLSLIAKSPVELMPFISELLPASPAAIDKDYQDRWKFTYSNSTRVIDGTFFHGIFPESCVSFTKRDFVKMNMLTIIYNTLLSIRLRKQHIDIEPLVDKLLQSDEINILEENLYDNWHNHNNFFFTKKFAPGMPDTSPQSACFHVHETKWNLINNDYFLNFVYDNCN
jgi:putative methyltransferase